MKNYTPEQIQIAKEYEQKIFSAINDQEEFDRVTAEFEAIRKTW